MSVRTRFAPSPSGYLHIGGVRTAIFNWAYARQHGGQFYLRIDDTDTARNVHGATERILEGFKWLDLDWDCPDDCVTQGMGGSVKPVSQSTPTSPYNVNNPETIPGLTYQSLRGFDYIYALHKLTKAGLAYQCFCSKDEIAEDRKRQGVGYVYNGKCRNLSSKDKEDLYSRGFCWRLDVSKFDIETLILKDMILGKIEKQVSEIGDFVIMRNGGGTMYSLATVVDDANMGITHVIRGQEHISNTFPQMLIYHGLGQDAPQFAHIPFICAPVKAGDSRRKKLSKRDADKYSIPVYLDQYRDLGYLPESIFNYLTHLGWSMDGTTEKWSRDEFVQSFGIRGVMKSPAVFDIDKLNWLQGEHFKELTHDEKCDRVHAFYGVADAEFGVSVKTSEGDFRPLKNGKYDPIPLIVRAAGDRLTKASDIQPYEHFWKDERFSFDPKAVKKRLNKAGARDSLHNFIPVLERTKKWKAAILEAELRHHTQSTETKPALLIHALRVATTGQMVGFGLFDGLEILGKKRTLERISDVSQNS